MLATRTLLAALCLAAVVAAPSGSAARQERPLPGFEGTTLDGRPFSVAELLGRRLLVLFFRPGDAQFLNNYLIWHARTPYVDHPEAERKRDLYRLWLTMREPLDLPDDFRTGGITDRTAAFA